LSKPPAQESDIDAEFRATQELKTNTELDKAASLALDAKILAMEEADAKAAGKEGK